MESNKDWFNTLCLDYRLDRHNYRKELEIKLDKIIKKLSVKELSCLEKELDLIDFFKYPPLTPIDITKYPKKRDSRYTFSMCLKNKINYISPEEFIISSKIINDIQTIFDDVDTINNTLYDEIMQKINDLEYNISKIELNFKHMKQKLLYI